LRGQSPLECTARPLGISGRTVHMQPKRLYAAPRDTYEYFKKADVNTELQA
jgi:hypothetical protein